MKRTFLTALVGVMVLLLVPSVTAQVQSWEVVSDHYRVISEVSEAHAAEVADLMEAMMELYNRQFRFAVDEVEAPLRVRVFADKSRYDSYLRRLINETRPGVVYLHYGDPAKSELVGYHTTTEDLSRSYMHQSFIQFLRTFIPNPPLWIREGFAVHFEASVYDEDFGAAVFRENLAWLDTLKEIVSGEAPGINPIPLDQMLGLSVDDARHMVDVFYPQAWGMVNFLLNADRPETNRILWDSISALSPTASREENDQAVFRRAFRWVNQDALQEEFLDYIGARRTFRGWVEHAVAAFESGDMDEAERGFVQAINLRTDNHVPYYFLGLINYDRGNFGLADFYYQQALDNGAEQAVTLFALGVNAYAANRFEDALAYLESTIAADPRYRERAENLLLRIRG